MSNIRLVRIRDPQMTGIFYQSKKEGSSIVVYMNDICFLYDEIEMLMFIGSSWYTSGIWLERVAI